MGRRLALGLLYPGFVLEVQNVRKRYGSVQAVDGISFRVNRGETIGLLGPNGAGKTTTVSMISGLVNPDEGQVLIEGAKISGDRDPVKRKIGLVPQDLALSDELPARANLELFAALYDIRDSKVIDQALDLVALIGLRRRSDARTGDDRISILFGLLALARFRWEGE